jgi:hypothetical protein
VQKAADTSEFQYCTAEPNPQESASSLCRVLSGAQGLLQLMPQTAATIASEINYPPISARKTWVCALNLTLGAIILPGSFSSLMGMHMPL